MICIAICKLFFLEITRINELFIDNHREHGGMHGFVMYFFGLLRGNEIYDMASTKSFIIKIIQVSYVHVNSNNIYGGIVIYASLDFNNS